MKITLTDEILEAAAREFCKQSGLDPDFNMSKNYVNSYYPRWKTYVSPLRSAISMVLLEDEVVPRPSIHPNDDDWPEIK